MTTKTSASAQTSSIVIRIALFTAASAVLGFVKLPSTVGSIALDAVPGYFVAAFYGPVSGGAVAALGHLASAASAGFPLGPGHLFVAVHQFAWAFIFGYLIRRVNRPWILYVASAITILLNGVATPLLLAIFPIYRPLLRPLLVFLPIAAGINVVAAAVLFRIIGKSRIPGV